VCVCVCVCVCVYIYMTSQFYSTVFMAYANESYGL
jgi:hypothetical protein